MSMRLMGVFNTALQLELGVRRGINLRFERLPELGRQRMRTLALKGLPRRALKAPRIALCKIRLPQESTPFFFFGATLRWPLT